MIGNLFSKIFGGIKETELEEKFLSLLSEFNKAKEMAALAVKKCDDIAALTDSALSEKSTRVTKLQLEFADLRSAFQTLAAHSRADVIALESDYRKLKSDYETLKTRVDNWSGYLENKNTQPVVKRGRGRPRKVPLQ